MGDDPSILDEDTAREIQKMRYVETYSSFSVPVDKCTHGYGAMCVFTGCLIVASSR
jgi:hypothetical protein